MPIEVKKFTCVCFEKSKVRLSYIRLMKTNEFEMWTRMFETIRHVICSVCWKYLKRLDMS